MLCARSAVIRRITELKGVVTAPFCLRVRCVHRLEKKAGVLLCHFPRDRVSLLNRDEAGRQDTPGILLSLSPKAVGSEAHVTTPSFSCAC